MAWSSLGVSLSLSHTYIGLPWGFNFNFPTSMPVSFVSFTCPGDHLVSGLLDMNFPKLFNFSFLKAVARMDTPK